MFFLLLILFHQILVDLPLPGALYHPPDPPTATPRIGPSCGSKPVILFRCFVSSCWGLVLWSLDSFAFFIVRYYFVSLTGSYTENELDVKQLEETPTFPLPTHTPFHPNERLHCQFVPTKERITRTELLPENSLQVSQKRTVVRGSYFYLFLLLWLLLLLLLLLL